MAITRIGMASFAHIHAASYAAGLKSLPDVEIASIWDDDEQRGTQMAQQFETRFEPDYDRFLAEDTAGVIVCTDNAGHKDAVVRAARSGKHVMCEKPISTNLDDARAMIEACRDAGVHLATAFPCRFSPAMMRLRDAVREGKIGEVLGIAGTNRGSMPGGWFIDLPRSGGGAVIDHTVHVTDLIRWMTGADVTRVYAEISNEMFRLTFDDCGTVSMDLDNGVFATLDTSWSRPKSYPTWGDVTMEVVGSDGLASLDMFNQKTISYNDSLMKVSYHPWGSNIDTGLVKAFVQACNGDFPEQLATGVDGMKALEVALAAYESALHKEPVDLPLGQLSPGGWREGHCCT